MYNIENIYIRHIKRNFSLTYNHGSKVVDVRPGHECPRVTIVQWYRYHSRGHSPHSNPHILATMPQIVLLPSLGDHITFEKPKPAKWTIVAELSRGYVIHCIFQRVPGLRLAHDNITREYRSTPHKLF